LLAQVRIFAANDNRSVTNFIETALQERLGSNALRAIGSRSKAASSPAVNGNRIR